ncbi:adenosylcobinamide-phosphate synthase CbiB [Natrinema thermotolerans]|uniref:Probable cobalamin biosynthesis protein CobD n=1 Tax=Natrinema thermotolerans TaxID=121872 RepID=A0AAF0P9E3_9EURY|nr:adenosylcobinamide-phosphate synthase CbiB [Natrinema thermotolerans]QCC59825.1 cobalamin biosynthesis protein CobD [Natrinema thermotolerans]WMT06816.1 adenosylcobinamide-phosphate synthase CbiB [Natrinema thermotolerans]
MLTTLAVLGLAFSLDLLIGEPPTAVHPVAWFGRLVDAADRNWAGSERGQRLVGVAVAVLTPLVPAAVAGGLVLVATPLHPMAGPVTAALVLFLTTSLRSLLELTRDVVAATDGDPDRARERVRGLVGRDTSTLSPAGLRSAAVESAAENLADGLVATLVPFAVLAPVSLPAAAAAAAWVKGINTLDSMLGYPSKPIGTASARLDDLVMFLPARLAAVSIAVAAVDPLSLARARAWAQTPPSPNSGWPMATLACALGVRLEKVGVYDLNPDADLPTLAEGERAVAVVGRAAVVAIAVAVALAAIVTTVLTPFAPGLEPLRAILTTGDAAPAEVVRWA